MSSHIQNDHERTDTQLRPLIVFAIGLALLTGVSMWAMVVLFDYLKETRAAADRPASPLADSIQRPAVPLLQPNPPVDMKEVLRLQQEELNGYQWIDPEEGVVSIPINRAIDILAESGRLNQSPASVGSQPQETPAEGGGDGRSGGAR